MTEQKNTSGPDKQSGEAAAPAPAKQVAEAVQATAQQAAQTAHQVTEAAKTTAQQAAQTAQQVTEAAKTTAQHPVETAQQVTETAQVAAQRATVPVRVAQRRGRVFLWVALVALGAFAGLTVVVHGHQQNSIDLRITQFIQQQQRRQAWLGTIMEWVSAPGFAPWSWALPAVAVVVLRWLGYRLESLFMVGTVGASAIVSAIKIVLARPRPSDPSIAVAEAAIKDYSFPSGHTMQYIAQFGYATYLAYALLRPGWLRRVALVFFPGMILLVGPSRIALGHHWASDVLASYLLGTSFMIGHLALYRRLKARERPVAPGTSKTVPAEEAAARPPGTRE